MRTRAVIGTIILATGGLLWPPASATGDGPFQFYSVTPCRIVDTRNPDGPTGGPILAGNGTRAFPIAGQCGIPGSAKQVVLNVVIVAAQGMGHLRVWPYDPFNPTPPLVSTINFDAGEPAIANGAIVTLGSGGQIYTFLGTGGPNAHLVIDTTGYLQ